MPGVLSEMYLGGYIQRVEAALLSAVENSFQTHPMRRLTRSEVNRRFELCLHLIETLRLDLGWTPHRICDQLSYFLKLHLDGQKLDFSSAGDGWAVSTKDGTLSKADAVPYMTADEHATTVAGPKAPECDNAIIIDVGDSGQTD